MVHYSRLSKIVIDVPAADHDRELAFWSAATGQPLAQFAGIPSTTALRCMVRICGC